jgi:hypothetical protein
MNELMSEAEVAQITGYDMLSKQCQVLTDHGVFFVKDRNGCPHVTWYCFNHPTHLRFNNGQAHNDGYDSEPNFTHME